LPGGKRVNRRVDVQTEQRVGPELYFFTLPLTQSAIIFSRCAKRCSIFVVRGKDFQPDGDEKLY
jgi:hypothetical protein